MQEELTHKCTRCNSVYAVANPPNLRDAILSPKRYIPLEAFTHFTCPVCGYKELVKGRKFFGILSPRGLQYLIFIMICGFIIAIIISA